MPGGEEKGGENGGDAGESGKFVEAKKKSFAKVLCFLESVFATRENHPLSKGYFSRRAKVPCTAQDVFATCESFPHSAGRFRDARKFPAQCRTFSRRAKVSCTMQDGFAACESFIF